MSDKRDRDMSNKRGRDMSGKAKIGYQGEESSPGLRLLKKGQKGLIRAVFSRLGLIVFLLLFQLFLVFSFIHCWAYTS